MIWESPSSSNGNTGKASLCSHASPHCPPFSSATCRQVFEASPQPQLRGAGMGAGGGTPPRGYLQFDANFEGGNVAAVTRSVDGAEYEITLRHDSGNPK